MQAKMDADATTTACNSVKRRRVQCPLCKETLCYSAYCQHQQTQSCVPSRTTVASDSQDPAFRDTDHEGQCDDACGFSEASYSFNEDSNCEDDCDSDESTNSEGDPAPEVWDDGSDSESAAVDNSGSNSAVASEQSALVNSMVHILSFLLLFFQLCYHVSDRGLHHVLSMISSIFCWMASLVPGNDTIKQIASSFPKSLYSLRKQIEVKGTFKKYCVCPACDSIYPLDEDNQVNRKCTFVPFPNHPQASFRSECGADLMKSIKVKNKYKMVPYKLFLYNSITSCLEKFASRPGFFESCEAWRKLNSVADGSFMTDVYDGKLWKEWKPFLDVPGNLLLMLNVDWFKPFKHTVYSVGVIYLVIQNLPRAVRFKPENIIIVGTIPGPHEPKLTVTYD